MATYKPDRGLIVHKRWADLILSGKKIWEIRSSNCKTRHRIFILNKGFILGEVDIVDSFPVCQGILNVGLEQHRIPANTLIINKYKRPHVWVLKNANKYAKPIPYTHKQGCVIWMKFD
jgi:hypothetical protein